MKRATLGLAVCLALGLATPGFTQELKVSGTTVNISFPGHGLVTWEIAGPAGFHKIVSAKGSSAAIELGAKAADGLYKYNASAASGEKVPNYNPLSLDNGRGKEPDMIAVGVSMSGTFLVQGGAIVLPVEKTGNNDTDR